MTATPFPLQWPHQRPRTPAARRKPGKFVTKSRAGYAQSLTIAEALDRLQRELDLIGARFAVVSSNVETRLDGRPRSSGREPDDPGVAVFFQHRGQQTCLPCDTYSEVAQNIAAVAAHIEATRAIERHGVATVAEMFAGFAAIAAPASRTWWQVLDIAPDASLDAIEAAYRTKAKASHPDTGGSTAAMADLNAARDQARKERG